MVAPIANRDEFGGVAVEEQDEFGGVAVAAAPRRDAFGGELVPDAPVDRAVRKADLQAQQAAARSELLPRLAGQLVEPSPPAGLYRDMEQGFAPTMPAELPRAPRLTAQDAARGLDVLAGAAEFARQGAVNPNASTAMDERLARDVQPGVGSQIAAGVQQTAAGLADPEAAALMAATAGVGALPRLAQRGVSAGFAAWMAANAGTNAGELVNAFEADDVEGFARAATSLGMDATFATLSGLHAVKGIAGDRVPTGNTRPDGTPETRPAAYAQAVNRWLTGQVEKNFTPEQVRDMYRRVNTGEATAQEQELVRVINRQIESPGQALRQGVDVTTPGQPLVSPWLRDFLALTQGEPGVRLAGGQRSAAGSKPSPTESAASPLSANRSPLSSRPSLLSPPETVPPEAVVPSTAAPAPAGFTSPPALNPTPNPAPVSSSLTQRPEATMETRPAAPLGLQREPTVSPELADAIAAVRGGYNPEVEAQPETSNVQRPTSKPAELMTPAEWAEANLSPGLLKLAKESVADQQDLLQPYVDAIREAVKAGRTLSAAAWEAGTRAGWPSKLEAKAQSYRWKNGFYSPTSEPTPPDQSGGPTELTPPAKGTAEPLSPTEVSEFNALEQARRAGTLDAAGAARYRELEVRAGQGDLLAQAVPEVPKSAAARADAGERGYYKEPSGKTVIVMPKAEYDALPEATRSKIVRYFNWSPRRKAFISKASKDDYWARQIAREVKLEEMEAREAPEPVTEAPAVATAKESAKAADRAFEWKPPASDKQGLARDREEIAATEVEFQKLQAEWQHLHALNAELAKRVINSHGKRWERGNIKTSAKKSDVEAYQAQKDAMARLDRAMNDLRARVRPAANRVRVAELNEIANSPGELPVRQLGAALGALYESGQDVPEQAQRALEQAAREEIRRRIPDVQEMELQKMDHFLASDMMNGRVTVDESFKNNPGLDVQKLRRQQLVEALAQITKNEVTADLPQELRLALAERVPGWEHLRYGGNVPQGKFSLGANDVAKFADEVNRAVKTKQAADAAARAAAEAQAAATKAAEEAEAATVRQMMADAAEEMAKSGTKRSATEIKKELVARLEAAVKAAPVELGADGAKRRVLIGVPGDGVFALVNTKAVLQEVLDRAKAMSTATGVANTGKARGTPVPAVNKKALTPAEVVKQLEEFEHPDDARVNLRQVYSEPGRALVSDGRTLIEVKGSFPSKNDVDSPFPVALSDGVAAKALAGAEKSAKVSTEDLFRIGRLRMGLEWGDQEAYVDLFEGNDGRIYGEAKDKEQNIAGYGRPTTDRYLGRYNAEGLEKLARLARKLGDEAVTLTPSVWMEKQAPSAIQDGKKKEPLKDIKMAAGILQGTGWRAVTMRFNNEATVPSPEATKVAESGAGSPNASVGDFRAPVPARPAQAPETPAGAGFADSGLFVDGVEVRLGGSGAVNPVLMPEVYRIYNALTGGDSPFLRRYRTANGMFYAAGAGRIGLHPDLFKFPHQAAYTFAHEVGHLGDYLPDRTLDRGNIFGSIGTLRQWLTTTFPLNPSTPLDDVLKPEDRRKLRSAAESEIRRTLGPRPSKEESEADWATWGNEVTRRYQELVEEEIAARGLVSLAQVREELLALTQWWRPYDPATAPESYRKYRESARELYADALSVLFNSPGHLEQMAPTFYKMFWAWLDTKPEFKAALARTQELLAKGDAEVLRARVADDRADFEKGRAAFEAAHAEQERTFTDVRAITARLMRQFVDRGEALTELSEGPRLGGVLPQGMDPREAWEQMLMADNLIYQFSSAVAERVVKPLQDAGLNADTDIGVYLKHTRIQGNKSAREELDIIKARLGRATYTQAEKFADLMEELVRKGIAETQMIDRVILPAEAAGIEFDDITEISRLRLEQGTRVDIANPRLVQAAESERTLAQYLADLGPAKAKALEQAAAAFRDIVFNLVEQGHAAQVFTDRQLQTAQANRHTYAAFRPLDHVDTWVSWTMRRAKGSAKPIENPFVTTMLKMQGLAQAIMENRAKLATRDAMQPVAPESFVKAETYWTGRGQQAKPPAKDMARLIVREQGKPVAYDVDPAIAEAFEKLTPFEQDTAAAWVNWLFHKTLYRGYVSWSLPFNFWTNPNRDIRRTYLNLGAVFGKRAPSMTDLARAYKDAWADAKAYVAGELTPLSREAMEFYAIYAPTDAFYSQFPQDDPSHAIFVKLGLVSEPASKARAMADKVPVLKQALAVGDWVTQQGQQREAVGKLGTWLALRRAGFEPEQAAPFVRNYAGTPNTKVSGSGSAVPNAIFPFYRIWMQALRNWAKLVRNPKTRGGWMFRWAITAGTLRALLGLAGLGYFGKELKDWIDGVPEYDRTRGVPVPVPPLALPGGDYGKKSLYLRLPDDEFSALMGYSLDNAMRAAVGQKGAGQAASDAAAQWLTSAPALNTFADLTAQWLAYAGNGVPEDRFRNRPVLTEPERKAGGAQAFGKMVAFSLDKAGVPMLRQPASEPGSDAEQVLRFTPLLKDIFKVSDAGFREKDMAQRDAVEQVKYAIRMDYGDDTKYLLHRHAVLDRAGTTRTLAQEAEYAFLKRWHADYNRLDAAIVAAQQQNERGEAKERIRDLETASTAYKTAMEQAKAERERPAGPRAVPWSPRLTNAVPARR